MNTLRRKYLLTTPRGLVSLHKVHPTVTLSLAAVRTSTDCAFLDAYLAHRLHGWMALLASATNQVVLDCQPRQASKRGIAKVESAAPRNLASLFSALKVVREGYSRLPQGNGGSSASRLRATPESLLALRKVQPTTSVQGWDGFISTETMYRDAAMAQELENTLLNLYASAAVAYQECHSRKGKPSMPALAALEASLAPAREWSWERIPQGQARPSGLRSKEQPEPAGVGRQEPLAPARSLDRSAA